MKSRIKKGILLLLLGVFVFSLFSTLSTVYANEVDELNAQIEDKRARLEELDKEIAKQKAAVNSASGRAKNLQSNILQLESSKRKLTSDISYTETSIEKAELTINKLNIEIDDKEYLISKNSGALGESIRRMNEMENVTLVEKFLGYEKVSDFWNDLDQTMSIQKKFHTELELLFDLYTDLTEKEEAKSVEKDQLASEKTILASEKEAVLHAQEQKETLLLATKNEEATYQRVLNEKLAQKKAFEQELLEIESKLNYLIDPDSYPDPSKGVISWPLSSIYVTQYFGGTQFAKTNPHVYSRPFHPGVDFGASIGSKVKSVSRGVIKGFGNTDAYPGCSAWGKWILVEHPNGLSSLYAHLSSISVSVGQQVTTGQTIGLSGNTGISTGPHLHLSLYASQGVRVGRYSDFKSGTGCSATAATGPFADLDAYLDPMQYLPQL